MAEPSKKIVNRRSPVVLLSPLDWGMGHTTRCIPIIRALTKLSCSIIVACNSTQRSLLSGEFSNLEYVDLEGYNIFYGKHKSQTLFNLIRQVPKILTAIKEERWFLEDYIAQNEIDIIISDNRYGFFHPRAYSVIVTHQLQLHSGLGTWIDRQGQRQLYRFLTHFDQCLVPDQQTPVSIAGALSNPSQNPAIPVKYIGTLTRFEKPNEQSSPEHILVLLSGPEPQRSILESKILLQIEAVHQKIIIVRGSANPLKVQTSRNLTVIDIAGTDELQSLINKASLVICRSGYSSLMDLFTMGKKILAIPTPGQGEQEYLAQRLAEEGYLFTCNQKKLDLPSMIPSLLATQLKPFPIQPSRLEEALKSIIDLAAVKKQGLTFAPQENGKA